ncbi:MAG: hypothetical protein IJZ39_12850 [Oscillospiraceae bacterium]|nr:hypothetical protein [Oscillospiraceae bacterium]
MNQLIARRILDVQELTEVQREILLDYLGVCVELHLQMLEKAIEMK